MNIKELKVYEGQIQRLTDYETVKRRERTRNARIAAVVFGSFIGGLGIGVLI